MSKGETSSSRDKNWHIYRIGSLSDHLRKTYGPPDIITDDHSKLLGKRGILIIKTDEFGVDAAGQDAARGHADLFDGKECVDQCYKETKGTREFWILPD